MPINKKCIIITGATCSGKTQIAFEFACEHKLSIVSADARQCFRELNAGVAKPSADMLARVPHYFIDTHSVSDKVDAYIFENYALEITRQIFRHSDRLLIVGGAGLYLRAFTEGLSAMQSIPEDVQAAVRDIEIREGQAGLLARIAKEDPHYYTWAKQNGACHNARRLARALEVMRTTGYSILSLHKTHKTIQGKRDFDIVQIALARPRAQLYERINARVDEMMKAGLMQEVRTLATHPEALPIMRATIGYKELLPYIHEASAPASCIAQIKQHTRHYAKRQLTWFRADKSIIWTPEDASTTAIKTYLRAHL